MSSSATIQLRNALAERFPTLRLLSQLEPEKAGPVFPTGVSQIDQLLGGGLSKSAITELVSNDKTAGGALILCSIIRHTRRQWIGLIDGSDCFDPTPLDFNLSRLLWVRCQQVAEALKATDLLLRDGNLPLILLDLAFNPVAQLRKTPATVWYRLQRLAEHKPTALLVITPRPTISSAKARLHLYGNFNMDALEQPQTELLRQLKVTVTNKRDSTVPRFNNSTLSLAEAG